MREWEVQEGFPLIRKGGKTPGLGTGVVLLIQGGKGQEGAEENAAILAHLKSAGVTTVVMDLLPWEGDDPDAEEMASLLKAGSRKALRVADDLQTRGPEPVGLGLFGSGYGGAVALSVAGHRPEIVKAVVCRGSPAELTGDFFSKLETPILFLSGVALRGAEAGEPVAARASDAVLEMYAAALEGMSRESPFRHRLDPGPWFLFQEEGSSEEVTRDTWVWFQEHLFGGATPEGEDADSGDVEPWARLAGLNGEGGEGLGAEDTEKGKGEHGPRGGWGPENMPAFRLPPGD